MTRRTKLVGSLAVLAVAIAMAAMIAVIQRRTAPVTPTENVPTTWETARKVPMHAAHVERGHVACASCHTAGFEEKPTEAACAKCHSDATAHAHRGDAKAPTTCTTCHVFAAGKPEATCVGCHGSTATTATANEPAKAAHALARHVSKEAACSSCHDVHGDKAAKTRTVLGDCTACHTSVKVEHGRVSAGPHPPGGANADPRVCSACHAPHAPAVDARESCATCHVGGKGARAHASDADAHAKGGEILLAGFAPAVEPRGEHVAGHAACVTCHEPHRAEKTDVRKCEDCHADHRSATTTVAGHTACTGCHTPHAPAEAKASCTTAGCHAGKTALAAPRVAAHAKCESCHDPHKPTASPALACVGCHEDLQPKHPGFASKTAGASTCIGCHAPHGGKPLANATSSATASACSTCHTKARTDRGLHAGGVACVACHKPHDFASNLLRTAAGAPAHGIPAPAAKGEEAALCAGCHAPKAAAVAARPGHAECGACHGAAHAPAKRPACVTCHAQETATAPRGHSVCTQCHDSHSGSLGTHALCTSCHAEKPKQQHGALPGAGCATCHTPHGPKGVTTPPACTSCHAKPKLEGLHSVGAHDASCASCHSSHSAPRSDRATCTSSCHLDRRDHQPAAKVCKGCHMFRN